MTQNDNYILLFLTSLWVTQHVLVIQAGLMTLTRLTSCQLLPDRLTEPCWSGRFTHVSDEYWAPNVSGQHISHRSACWPSIFHMVEGEFREREWPSFKLVQSYFLSNVLLLLKANHSQPRFRPLRNRLHPFYESCHSHTSKAHAYEEVNKCAYFATICLTKQNYTN